MEITDKKLIREIEAYCSMNNLDLQLFVDKIAKKGFTVERYGTSPVNMQAPSKKTEKKTKPVVYEIGTETVVSELVVSEPEKLEPPIVEKVPKKPVRKKKAEIPEPVVEEKEIKPKKRIIQAK